MAKQALNLGSTANDNTGDTLRGGGDKINIDTPASATKPIEGGTNFLDLLKIRPIMNLFGGGR